MISGFDLVNLASWIICQLEERLRISFLPVKYNLELDFDQSFGFCTGIMHSM